MIPSPDKMVWLQCCFTGRFVDFKFALVLLLFARKMIKHFGHTLYFLKLLR